MRIVRVKKETDENKVGFVEVAYLGEIEACPFCGAKH